LSEWTSDDSGLHETRQVVEQRTDGYYGGLEVSERGGEPQESWSSRFDSIDAATKAAADLDDESTRRERDRTSGNEKPQSPFNKFLDNLHLMLFFVLLLLWLVSSVAAFLIDKLKIIDTMISVLPPPFEMARAILTGLLMGVIFVFVWEIRGM
jgi:hypothetical protein